MKLFKISQILGRFGSVRDDTIISVQSFGFSESDSNSIHCGYSYTFILIYTRFYKYQCNKYLKKNNIIFLQILLNLN